MDRFQPPNREQEFEHCACCDARKHYTELDVEGRCVDCIPYCTHETHELLQMAKEGKMLAYEQRA